MTDTFQVMDRQVNKLPQRMYPAHLLGPSVIQHTVIPRHPLFQNLLLVQEMIIKRPFRHPHGLLQVGKRNRLESFFQEQQKSCLDNRVSRSVHFFINI